MKEKALILGANKASEMVESGMCCCSSRGFEAFIKAPA